MKELEGNHAQDVSPLIRGGLLIRSCGVIAAAMVAIVLLSTGCMMGPKFKTPEVQMAPQWREMGQPQYSGQPVDSIEWWKSLNDPILNSLIQQAFKQNLSLQAASLRIVQARVARATAGLTFLPLITGTGSIAGGYVAGN